MFNFMRKLTSRLGRLIRVKLEKRKLQMHQFILFSIYERLTYLLREGKLEIDLYHLHLYVFIYNLQLSINISQ